MPQFAFSQKIGSLRRALRREFEADIAPFEITATQFQVLRRLWSGDGIGAACLGKQAHLDGATLTGVLDRLETKGLLRREKHETDRRSVRIFLSEAGRALEEPLVSALGITNDKALEGFSPEEVTSLLALLDRVQVNLDALLPEPTEKGKGECNG